MKTKKSGSPFITYTWVETDLKYWLIYEEAATKAEKGGWTPDLKLAADNAWNDYLSKVQQKETPKETNQ